MTLRHLETPNEARLRNENDRLRNENDRLKNELRVLEYQTGCSINSYIAGQPTIEKDVSMQMPSITLPRLATVTCEKDHNEGCLSVVGKSSGPGGGFGFHYFADRRLMVHRADRAAVLSDLHRKVLEKLSREIG